MLPLPEDAEGGGRKDGNGSRSSEERPGFGTKRLPNGTRLLVDNEKLLRNAEATKRIFLQRSVDAYKRRTVAAGSGTARDPAIDTKAEEEIATAREEAERLREAVVALRDEMIIILLANGR